MGGVILLVTIYLATLEGRVVLWSTITMGQFIACWVGKITDVVHIVIADQYSHMRIAVPLYVLRERFVHKIGQLQGADPDV